MSQTLTYALLPLAGFVAGVINTIAGGGSFLTLPCLMLLGMPEQVANGTNRVAVAIQSAYAVPLYHREQPIDWRTVPPLLSTSLPGMALGAYLATALDPAVFRGVLGGLFLGFVALMLYKPKRLLEGHGGRRVALPWRLLALFGLGLYAGFLQAGIGVLLLMALSALYGQELKQANGLKLLLTAIWIVPALLVFAWAGQVRWMPGLLLGVGNMLGARVGTRLAIRKGNRLIFAFVVGVMTVTGLRLLVGFLF